MIYIGLTQIYTHTLTDRHRYTHTVIVLPRCIPTVENNNTQYPHNKLLRSCTQNSNIHKSVLKCTAYIHVCANIITDSNGCNRQ